MTSLVATRILTVTLPEAAWKWIYGLGGPGLILFGIADNLPVFSAPAGSIDVLVIMLAAGRHEMWAYYAVMAAIGEVGGGYLTYRLAKLGGQAMLKKEKVRKRHEETIYKSFKKYGLATVLIGSVLPPPFPFTPVLIIAGLLQYPRAKLVLTLTAGRMLRFFAAAALGRIYGRQILNVFAAHYVLVLSVVAALSIAGAVVYFAWYRPKSQREKKADQSQTATSNSAQ